jgi:DNA-binding CsgD family transcriptional regulator
MFDLSRLSPAERQALVLLAQGHTAKSAASQLGTTEAAVNERLREARRKTGVGSSRELARLASQETRDEKFGVATTALDPATGRRVLNLRAPLPMLLGVFAMIVLASVIGAFTALAVAGHHPAPSPPSAPLPAPRVVAVSPAVGAEVAAGRIQIKVTFDRPMADGYSFIARDEASYPNCAAKPTQSADGRSFTLNCVVVAGKDYWIGFNNARFQKFMSVEGVAATPAVLRFSAH